MATKKKIRDTRNNVRDYAYTTTVSGKRIKALREKAGLSQSDAATFAGWSAQRWSDIENERGADPRISTVLTVCRVLKCRIDDLLKA